MSIRSKEAVAIIAALRGDAARARLAWSKYVEAYRISSARLDTDALIRKAEHAIITLESEIEMARRIRRPEPEKQLRLDQLVEEIARLRRDRRKYEAESVALARETNDLQRAAADATEGAIEALRASMGTEAVLAMARALGVETPAAWERSLLEGNVV